MPEGIIASTKDNPVVSAMLLFINPMFESPDGIGADVRKI
jgi:hypothetical protein